ncbi:anhydro-N-acetylmuramic acid kinase [Lutibacter sp.]|uniref:anhydro-N-acetylmuramic acid kinase n=1 Tax=Lutibacter sp. TaxID=1925666 RepID=UPI002733E194|nr:anhydro-N-acetylmuramic acid kinase [Lutibacter sp.]MDP3313059.1 anhydro-N-acetylmuramic acid kinase [Lutibacter sp.]
MSTKSWRIIGLMSGTSLDGVDLVFVQFNLQNNLFDFEIKASETVSYSKLWEKKLRNAFNASKIEVEGLNFEYGQLLGELINGFITKNNCTNIDFIASHGHTIFHKPNEGYTLQIGDGQTICNITNHKVVCDFRTQDVAFGGQGAPLVPIGDKLLFSEYEFCLNLGGFANISFEKNNQRIAFDICPVNIVLNHFSNLLGFPFDAEGKLASEGTLNENLLFELNEMDYFKKPIPKSLGFEFIKENVFPIINKYQISIKDILKTYVAHSTQQIANCLDNKTISKVLVTGGGAFNTYLIKELKLLTKTTIIIPDNKVVNFKEAMIFAFLGLLRSENKVNCLSSVTGAKYDHSSGKIFLKRQ